MSEASSSSTSNVSVDVVQAVDGEARSPQASPTATIVAAFTETKQGIEQAAAEVQAEGKVAEEERLWYFAIGSSVDSARAGGLEQACMQVHPCPATRFVAHSPRWVCVCVCVCVNVHRLSKHDESHFDGAAQSHSNQVHARSAVAATASSERADACSWRSSCVTGWRCA